MESLKEMHESRNNANAKKEIIRLFMSEPESNMLDRRYESFDDLMSLAERIEKTNLGTLKIETKGVVTLSYNSKSSTFWTSDLKTNLFDACYEFIKWYNFVLN
jgi:hypothetical protein